MFNISLTAFPILYISVNVFPTGFLFKGGGGEQPNYGYKNHCERTYYANSPLHKRWANHTLQL